MAVLQPTGLNSAVVIATTANAGTIGTGGIFVLHLVTPATLVANTTYYLAVYNQVNGSELGAVSAGLGTTQDAPPINFRAQNLAGFAVGQIIDTSDVSLRITPWLAAF